MTHFQICYQTKTNDEGLTSVDTFSEEKCRFVQYYRRLCQSPELFKTKEAFSEMRRNQAREVAKKKKVTRFRD